MIKVIKNSKYLILFCLLMMSSLSYSQGSRYTGTYTKSAPIEYSNKNNIVIEGLEFSDANNRTLTLWSCDNIIIRNCKFKDVNISAAIYAQNSTNITITDCTFENVHRAFIAGETKGNIKFEHNDVKNILGTTRGGVAFSQAVQFINSSGAGNSISYNSIENISKESSPEDIINIYNSNGTASSPLMVKGNWIRGGGPSLSGGGILLGDNGGSYQIAEDNILVNPGQYGMGIGGGKNMTLRNNKIYAKKQSFTNVGLSIANWTIAQTGVSTGIVLENNEVNWLNKDGLQNIAWFDNNMRNSVPNWATSTKYNPNLNESILPAVIIGRASSAIPPATPPVVPPTVPPVMPPVVPPAVPPVAPPIISPDDNTPSHQLFEIYTDRFNRVSVKCLLNPIPVATAQVYTSSMKLIAQKEIYSFRTLVNNKLKRGQYIVHVSYGRPVKTIEQKITIK